MKSRKTQEDYLTNLITRSILKSMEEEGVSLTPPGGAAPGGMGGGMGAPAGGGMGAAGGMGGGMGAAGGMGGGMDDDDDDQMMGDEDQDMDTEGMDDEDAMNELKEVFTSLPKDLQEELINALTDIMHEGSSDDDDMEEDMSGDDEEGMDDDEYSDDNEDAPTVATKSVSRLGNREEYVLKSLASDYLSIRGATYDRDQERAKIVDTATKNLNISPAAFRAYANKLYKRR